MKIVYLKGIYEGVESMAKSSTSKFYGTSRNKDNGHKTRREIVKDFVSEWTNKGKDTGYGFIKEDANRQPFINDFLRRICGIEQPTKYVEYEKDVQVKDGDKISTRRIDAYIPSTKVMIEMKGSNKSLVDKIEQSGGKKLTPFEQAQRYSNALPQREKPNWIIISNFVELDIHDMNKPLEKPAVIKLSDLDTKYKAFDFMIDATAQQIIDEKKLSIDAGILVSKIYKELAHAYSLHADLKEQHIQKSLNMLIVRIVFLLYADDTGILGEENLFQRLLEKQSPDNIRQTLISLFDTLNKPEAERDPFLSDSFKQFKYVNGGMFADETVAIPQFTEELKRLIVDDAGKGFNWANISPTIFGAVFESTLNPDTRRKGGMHYTSIENIHKVIDPLFLDNLTSEFDKIKDISKTRDRVEAAREFQNKIAKLKFFDPACGSGNFLTETYLSLRKLENQCLRIIVGNNSTLNLDSDARVKVKIQNYYGLEINDFAVSVARTAMWIAESQMWDESQNIIFSQEDFLPLDSNDSIYEGNALRMDWTEIVKPYELNYVMGNPPFIGKKEQSKSQKQDLKDVFDTSSIGTLDYVTGWYSKALDYIKGSTIHCAFVSTNSIAQGEQVPKLWKLLSHKDITINFAYRSFGWDNEAKRKAHVHVIIIGFSTKASGTKTKILFDENANPHKADNINPYLLNAPEVLITNRSKPLCDVEPMNYGSMPIDHGHLILSADEREAILKKDPDAEKFIKPYYGGNELLHNKPRYCLWLVNVSPSELRGHDLIIDRINECREYRLSRDRDQTIKAAETPSLFGEIRQPNQGDVIVFPKVSSEQRQYIPIGYLNSSNIISGSALMIKNGSLAMFGVLNSVVHNAWMRVVAGRLETRYQYSSSIVYNNFPWPEMNEDMSNEIAHTAQGIIDARNQDPTASLAELYKPKNFNNIELQLKRAHEENDKAVLKAYNIKQGASEQEIVEHLFKMYADLAKK